MGTRIGDVLGAGLGLVVLLVGIVTGALSVEAMLVAAWLENLSIGAATVVALLRSPDGRVHLPASVQVSGIPVRDEPGGGRSIPSGCAAGFFAAHFGIFTVVHGVFLAIIVGAALVRGGGEGLTGTAALVLLAAAVLRAFRRLSPRRAVVQAYAGLIPVHVAILALFGTAVDGLGGASAPWDGDRGTLLSYGVVALLLVGDLIRAAVGRRGEDGEDLGDGGDGSAGHGGTHVTGGWSPTGGRATWPGSTGTAPSPPPPAPGTSLPGAPPPPPPGAPPGPTGW